MYELSDFELLTGFPASGHNSLGSDPGGSRCEALHCIHGYLCVQEGCSFETFKMEIPHC